MIKTHERSKISLLTLSQIRDTPNVILQAVQTGARTSDGEEVYLCEVCYQYDYTPTKTIERVSEELLKVNAENRRLRSKVERLENQLKKVRSNYEKALLSKAQE